MLEFFYDLIMEALPQFWQQQKNILGAYDPINQYRQVYIYYQSILGKGTQCTECSSAINWEYWVENYAFTINKSMLEFFYDLIMEASLPQF